MSVGACVSSVIDNNITEGNNRVILGNVLTGKHIQANGYIGFYDQMITVIPEGDQEEFLGWLIPTYPRPSISRTLPSFLMPEKKYKVNTWNAW
ncbi:MAG: hypothetical protein R2852_01725 [Bacteroidia bacterium]